MLGGIEKSEVTPPPTKKTQGTNQTVLRPRPASPPYQKSSHSASVHARMCNSPLHPSPRVCAQGPVQQLTVLYGAV